MASGDISIGLIGVNQLSPAVAGSIASLGGLDGAIDRHISKLNAETRATHAFNRMIDEEIASMNQLQVEQSELASGTGRLAGMSGRSQQAMQQMVFAADDAIASYGTGGLQGAIRGAANNLSMVAMIAGGVTGQIAALAAIAGIQLVTAFSNAKRSSDSLRDSLERTKEETAQLQNQMKAFEQFGDLRAQSDRLADPHSTFGTGELVDMDRKAGDEIKQIESERRQKQIELEGIEAEIARTKGEKRGIEGGFHPFGADTTEVDKRLQDLLDQQLLAMDAITDMEHRSGELQHQRDVLIPEAMEGAQQREAAEEGARIQQDQIRMERERIADQKKQADEQRSMQQQMQRDMLASNPFGKEALQKFDIMRELEGRRKDINSLTNVDPAIRQQMLADAETIASRQLWSLRDRGLSAKGPAALRVGEAETFKFLAQARLGAAARTPEQKSLASLEAIGRQQLAELKALKQQGTDSDPEEFVDF